MAGGADPYMVAKQTFAKSAAYCWGYVLNVSWHWSKNSHRSSGFEPLKASGAHLQVTFSGGVIIAGGIGVA